MAVDDKPGLYKLFIYIYIYIFGYIWFQMVQNQWPFGSKFDTTFMIDSHDLTSPCLIWEIWETIWSPTTYIESVHRSRHWCPSFHMFSHVFTCFHMFSHVFTCFHMFSHVFTSKWDNVGGKWMYPELVYLAVSTHPKQISSSISTSSFSYLILIVGTLLPDFLVISSRSPICFVKIPKKNKRGIKDVIMGYHGHEHIYWGSPTIITIRDETNNQSLYIGWSVLQMWLVTLRFHETCNIAQLPNIHHV